MDKNKILKIVTSNPIIKIFEETKEIELLKFYTKLESLLKKDLPYCELNETFTLCIGLDLTKQGEWNVFDKEKLISKIKRGLFNKNNVILCNKNGDVIKVSSETYIKDYVDAEEFSRKNNLIVFFINYVELHIFKNGKAIHYITNIIQSDREGVVTSGCLFAKEYKQLIRNQYDEMVYKEKGFKYWNHKANRILIDKPEVHFHKPLWYFLNQKVIDGKVDSGATLSGTEDRTDIRVIEFNTGNIYLIEIKCLGKTEGSPQEKSDDWANIGLIQLNLYFNDEESAKEGLLVLYDGRKNDDVIKFNWNNSIKWHSGLDRSPLRFYLESESVSIKAKKIYKRIRKNTP